MLMHVAINLIQSLQSNLATNLKVYLITKTHFRAAQVLQQKGRIPRMRFLHIFAFPTPRAKFALQIASFWIIFFAIVTHVDVSNISHRLSTFFYMFIYIFTVLLYYLKF